MTRKDFLRSLSAAPLLSAAWPASKLFGQATGAVCPPWQPGGLDIHHIATGRGNSTLFLCPDGTSMMVDAGATSGGLKYTIAPKPDDSRRPGEWLGRYAKRHLQAAGRNEIDYFILTHLHGDHMGDVLPDSPTARLGGYKLTGVADVAEIVPIRRILDRGYPDYSYPTKQEGAAALNYIEFVKTQQKNGAVAEKFRAGSAQQIHLLRKPAEFSGFSVRNLAVNGEVWTGVGETTRHHFPALETVKPADYPSENMCCLALRLSYGQFDYYTGGDLPSGINDGSPVWEDIESPVARVAGPVEVAILNHHGYTDTTGAEYVRSLRPRAFILLAWDSAHPAISSLQRMYSTNLYPGPRDVYATALKAENKIANKGLANLKSDDGHILVRVAPGGKEFRVIILDNSSESDRVKAEFGPFPCG